MIFPLEQRKYASSRIFEKAERDQKQGTMKFLSTLLNQNLEPNYRAKAQCSYLSLKLNKNQEEHNDPPTNIFPSVRMTLTYKRPRQQQKK